MKECLEDPDMNKNDCKRTGGGFHGKQKYCPVCESKSLVGSYGKVRFFRMKHNRLKVRIHICFKHYNHNNTLLKKLFEFVFIWAYIHKIYIQQRNKKTKNAFVLKGHFLCKDSNGTTERHGRKWSNNGLSECLQKGNEIIVYDKRIMIDWVVIEHPSIDRRSSDSSYDYPTESPAERRDRRIRKRQKVGN